MFIYVISAGERLHKIGVSGNPERRLASLQTGHHMKLRLVEAIPCEAAPGAEYQAHAALAEHRLEGEWFAVDAETALAAVRRVAEFSRPKPFTPEPMNGESFRAWRKAQKKTAAQVAEEFGGSRATIHRWEVEVEPLPAFVPLTCAAVSLNLSPLEG